MFKISPMFFSIPAILVLSACGGSSTNSVNFSDIASIASDINLAAEDFDVTPESGIPTSGSATYEGYAVLVEGTDLENDILNYAAVGQSNVTVNFETSTASGSATNFYEVDVKDIDFDEGALVNDASGTAIAGSFAYNLNTDSVTGSLTKASGEAATYNMNVQESDFGGDNAEGLSTVSAGLSSSGGRANIEAGLITVGLR